MSEGRKKSSPVWKLFEPVIDSQGLSKGRCKRCKNHKLIDNQQGNTTGMIQHAKAFHRQEWVEILGKDQRASPKYVQMAFRHAGLYQADKFGTGRRPDLLPPNIDVNASLREQESGRLEVDDRQVLEICGMTFHGFHGVLEPERALGQKFVVDLQLWPQEGAFRIDWLELHQ